MGAVVAGVGREVFAKNIALDAGILHTPVMNLDDRDRRLVTALASDAWLSYAELGRAVNLSASAAQRRVEKLIANGVIKGAHAQIAPEALGKPLRLYVLVELMEESKAVLSAFARRVSACADVDEAHYVAGAFDVVLVLQAANVGRFADFADAHLNGNPHVRRYKTLTSLRPLF